MNKNISIKQVIIILLMIFTCGKLSAIEFEVGGIIYNSSNGNNVSVEGKINDYFGAIAIPETVTYQGVNYAVTRISEDAFWHDTDITSIIIPPTISFIDERAFDGCINLDTIYISSIESWCNIGFDKIDSNPLVYAKHLYIDGKEVNDIAIPEGITYIDEYAFCKFQGIRSLTLPKSLTRIWKSAFSDCSNLEIVISKCDTPPSFYGDNISPFSGISSKAKLLVPQGAIRTYISLSKWSNYFAEIVEDVNESSNIISFTDANVKEICIANWDSNGDGELSKEEASAVTDIGRAFRKSSIGIFPEFKYFTGLSYVGEEAFEKCSRLSYIIIPPNVKSLYYQAFKECGFTSFTIPDGVENIGGAFGGCSKLAIVKIPASVKSISSNIFPHTVSSIIIDKNNETYSSPNSNCIYDKLTNTLVFATKSTKISNGTIHIGDGAFIGVELTEIEIPNTVKTIGEYNQEIKGETNVEIIPVSA
ncbi:MAG: leucine-rich repeat protein [Prevotella sp.]|nr:leucine-rich repeat protein [Prevotella sp.]